MKVEITRTALVGLTSKAASVTDSGKSPYMALHAGADGTLRIDASGGDNALKTATTATVTQAGTAAVSAALMNEIARLSPEGSITLELVDTKLEVRAGRSHFRLPTADPASITSQPAMPAITGYVAVDALRAGIKAVEKAAATDATGSVIVMTALQLRSGQDVDGNPILQVTATDSRHLCTAQVPWRPQGDVSLNVTMSRSSLDRALTLFAAVPTIGLAIDGERIAGFFSPSQTFTTRVISGDYPMWERLMKIEATTDAILNRAEVEACLKRMSVVDKFARDLSGGGNVRIAFADGEATVSAGGANGGASETIGCALDGEPITVVFNGRYLSDALENITDDEVKLHITAADKPVLFTDKADSDTKKSLVMPVKTTS